MTAYESEAWQVEQEGAFPAEIPLGELDVPLPSLPYVRRGFGCTCDPYDCGPFGHAPDCPAREMVERVKLDIGPAAPLIVALAAEMAQQDRKYGRFSTDVQGVRLAAAALEDEAEEVKKAWRDERKVDGWEQVREEALQVAAVALRLWVELTDEAARHG